MRRLLLAALAMLSLCVFAACRDAPPAAPAGEQVLTLIYWQAPSLPGPYLASGYKDQDAGAITLEPLASYDPDGNLVPRLAVGIPTIANDGVSADQTSITWTLHEGLKWSDGSAMTARDVVFTWRYCTHAGTGCTDSSAFAGITSVEAIDERTVEIRFAGPTPYPYSAFVGTGTPIISAAQFADCVGAAARACDAEYDALFEQLAQTPIGPERDALVQRLNDILVQNYYEIPLVVRGSVSAHLDTLRGVRINGWDSELWNIAEWRR